MWGSIGNKKWKSIFISVPIEHCVCLVWSIISWWRKFLWLYTKRGLEITSKIQGIKAWNFFVILCNNEKFSTISFLTAILINSHSFHLIYFYCFSSTLTLSLAFNEEIFLSLHSQQGFAFKSALTIERGGGENECMHVEELFVHGTRRREGEK